MTKVKHLKKCRICNSKNLTKIVKLSKMPFTDEFMTFKNIGKEFLHDINVFLCKDCQVVQTQHDVEVNKYYLDYQYSVAHSKIANKFMCLLANNINSFYFKKISKKSILEVGSGDGKQLHQFKKIGFDVLGYEPSKILSDIANKNKIKTINGLFTKDSLNLFKAQEKYFDVILLTYTFDHLPNPGEFLDISKKLLKKNGILVVEVHDLDKISKNNEFCLFEHEHSIYLNKSSATKFLRKYDLDIINFNLIEEKYRRANSLIFVAKRKVDVNVQKKELLPKNKTSKFYFDLKKNIYKGIRNLEKYSSFNKKIGKRVAGYGAGGRGVMTLASMSNSQNFKFLIEKNPKSQNIYAPGSGLQIVNLEHLKENPVDEILVFSFGYMDEIKKDLKKYGYQNNQIKSFIDVMKDGYV